MRNWIYIYWKSALAIAVLVACLLVFVLSTTIKMVGEHTGVIVGIYPQGRSPGLNEHVMVKLENGDVIEVLVPSRSGFQYLPGTPVIVTEYQSVFLQKKSYQAKVNDGMLAPNNSLQARRP